MLFNSAQFLVFLAAVLGLLWLIPDRRRRIPVLLVASYCFYAAWDYRFVGLIFLSTVVDYSIALGLVRSHSARLKKALVTASVTVNLGILGFFKYWDFGVSSFAILLSAVGFEVHISTLNIILPVGISFYTFQTISYTVDVYRGVTRPTRNFVDFALYVAFFPQLVAGPIERSGHLLPQIQRPRPTTRKDWHEGGLLILTGYFKKVVLADTLAPMVVHVFSDVDQVSGVVSVIGAWAFAVQVYGDFAGYALIARGVSRWLGYDLVRNFRFPYFAANPRDFWSRWHISLSTWLRDYVYVPLGGSRSGRLRTYSNLVFTMTLCGLWHGAEWNFVVFGAYNGLLLVLAHAFGNRERLMSPATRAVSTLATFIVIVFGFMILRADNMAHAVAITRNIFTNFYVPEDIGDYLYPVLVAHALLATYHSWQIVSKNEFVILTARPLVRRAIFSSLLLSLVTVSWTEAPFFYFQF